MTKTKRILSVLFVFILLSTMFLFTGCSNENKNSISNINQIDGKVIGSLGGASYIPKLEKLYPNSEVLEYNTYADLIYALKTNRIDVYIADEPLVASQLIENDGIKKLDSFVSKERYGFMFNDEKTELCKEMNAVIGKLKDEGKLDYLKAKWVGVTETPSLELPKDWDKSKGTIEVGLIPDSDPFAFLLDGQFIGYDIELIYMIAAELGYGVNITPYDFTSVVASLESKKSDVIIGCITYTEERAETHPFSDSTYNSGLVAVVRTDEKAVGFLESIEKSFERTFIVEKRWKMLTEGLSITIELSVFTLVIGTLLGFGFSFMLRSKNKVTSGIANAISTVFDALPILITLMVLYYIVFAKTSLSPMIIGIIGLSFDFANSVASVLNLGVAGVAKGEIEAAYSMGYSKAQTFFKIVLPQAVNNIFSAYTSSVISMVKGTSIIGYITVIDLTKAGDIIRSRTYEAFFPLIVIALIYFVIARILVELLQLLAKRLDPKHRKRTVEGVLIND